MFTAPCSLTPRKCVYPFISPSRFAEKLVGQVVIVTGAGRSIGRSTTLAFAAAGASVCLVARRKADLEAVASEIESKYKTPTCIVSVDVADRQAAAKITAEAERKLGPINILVNNAGMIRFSPFELEDDPSLDDWWRVLEVNLFGAVSLTRAVLPGMLQRKQGTIINVVSTSGSLNVPFNTAYACSKAALIKFNQELHAEVGGGRGINLFAVHPGVVMTEIAYVKGAINVGAISTFPSMGAVFASTGPSYCDDVELSAQSFVMLCVEKRAAVLSGKYIDCQHDIEQVIEEIEKGPGNRVEKERLYNLRLDEL